MCYIKISIFEWYIIVIWTRSEWKKKYLVGKNNSRILRVTPRRYKTDIIIGEESFIKRQTYCFVIKRKGSIVQQRKWDWKIVPKKAHSKWYYLSPIKFIKERASSKL